MNYGINRSKVKQRKFLAQLIKRQRSFKPEYNDYFKQHSVFNHETRNMVAKVASKIKSSGLYSQRKKLSRYHGKSY